MQPGAVLGPDGDPDQADPHHDRQGYRGERGQAHRVGGGEGQPTQVK